MKFNILPIPFALDDSNMRDSDQSGFIFEYETHKWDVKFKEENKNFISISIIYQNANKKEDLSNISIPFKIIIKFENDFQHIIINHLCYDTFSEVIPFYYEQKQKIQVEAYLMPFLPLKCQKNYETIYYSAFCCYFMLNYCEINNPITEIKNNEENDDKYLIDQQDISQANNILQSLTSQPISIDLFMFYLNNYTTNENDPIPSSYNFSLLDYSPPTIQETISNIIFNYFSRIFNIKLDCFEKIEENSENLSYLSKISNDSIALVFLNPSTYKFDENYQITNNNNKMQYILYSMITYEGRNFCLYYYSFNLNKGFKFCEDDCVEFEIDKWPHDSSIITIFVRSDVVENFKKQNHFAVYRSNLDQIVTVYQFDFREVLFKSEDYINKFINELQDKNKVNCYFGSFETTRFSVLSKQNALIFKYDPTENLFPTFPSIDFDDSCLLITFQSSRMRKYVYQLIWFQKVTEQYPKDYFLSSKNEIKYKIYSPESIFVPSVQLIKQSNDIEYLFELKQMINKASNQNVYWQLAAVKNHCIQSIPLKKEDFSIDLLNFSLVFFACDNPQGMIPIAIRFGRYSKFDSETENPNIDFVFDDDDDNDNESNIKGTVDAFSDLDNYIDNRQLIFYGTPKLVYKNESDFPSFIQLIQSFFESFIVFFRYLDKNPKRPFKWKQISEPTKDLEILQNDIKYLPIQQQIFHLMLIEKNADS